MSLESLGCLESSKPFKPTIASHSNSKLQLTLPPWRLKIDIGNTGYWQHSLSSFVRFVIL